MDRASELRSALQSAQPGQTLWLEAGVYNGNFLASRNGEAGLPITLRAKPGHKVVLDGNWQTLLAAPIDSEQRELQVVDTSNMRAELGLMIGLEELQVSQVVSPTRVVVNRGWGATLKTNHQVGEVVKSAYNPVLKVTGSDWWIWGLEVANSDPNRDAKQFDGVRFSQRRGAGVVVEASRVRLINNLVYDNSDGMLLFDLAVDTEVYGNLIFNNGVSANDRGHGQGFYTHNLPGSKKVFENNICWNNFSTGGKAYGVAGAATGFEFVDHVAFNNGSPYTLQGEFRRANNLFCGSERAATDDITVRGCYLYHPPGAFGGGTLFGYAPGVVNGSVSVTDSFLLGDNISVSMRNFSKITFKRNTVLCRHSNYINVNEAMIMPLWLSGMQPELEWDFNSYVDQTRYYGGLKYPVRYGSGSPAKTFAQWSQETGADRSSIYGTAWLAGATNEVRVMPNKYERGRAHIAVINYDESPTVRAGLGFSGLVAGDSYLVYDVQDLARPVACGVYEPGVPVVLPMYDSGGERAGSVTPPSGWVSPKHTPREFGCFLVVKR